MRKIILLYILFIIGTRVSAQSFSFNQGEFVENDYFIELPYQKIKGKIIVDVQINNQLLKFILDTGAPTAVSKELSKNLGLEILSNEDITDINRNKVEFEIARINELKIGKLSIINIPAVVFEEKLITECFKVDGLIGSNLLRNSVIQFDDKNNLIRISSNIDNLDVSKAKVSEIFIDKQSSPILKIQLGERATEMLLFDTGDDILYSMAYTNMKKFKKTKTFSKLSESYGSTSIGINGLEKKSKKYRLSIPELTIQDAMIKNVVSETTTSTNSRIGCRLLQYGLFTVDYKNSKSYFEPYSKVMVSKELFWEVNPTFIDDQLVIGRIWTKEFKNLSVGDRIISINDINVENISKCDFLSNSPLSNIQTAILTVENSKGNILSIDIQKNN